MEITIRNFQSIKEADLSFGPGLTIVSGPSNFGKTAVVRAIKALLSNRSGKEFIRYGTNQCSVIVDGVEWHKGADSRYVVDGESFTRLGTSVPDEVYAKLSVYPVEMDGDKVFLGINEQFDAPFLLLSSPSKVAKLFGNFSSIDTVYSGMAKCVRDQKVLQNRRSYLETRKDEIEARLDAFPDIEGFAQVFSNYSALSKYKDAAMSVVEIPTVNAVDFRPYLLLRKLYTLRASQVKDVAIPEMDLSTIMKLRKYKGLLDSVAEAESQLSLVTFEKCPMCGQDIVNQQHEH